MSTEHPTSSAQDATHPPNGSTTVVDAIDDKRGQDPSASTSAKESEHRQENKSNGTTTTAATSAKTKGRKQSVWSKVFRKLVPCVGSSPDAHPVEIDKAQPKTVAEHPSAAEKKPVEAPAPPVAPAPAPAPSPQVDEALPQPSVLVTPTHESTPEADVILPPASTSQLPPRSETEGVTSSAVQIPGSTGHSTPSTTSSGASTVQQQQQHEHVAHDKVETQADAAIDGDEDSEGTYPDDEEVDDMNSLDDEDRLIMNGGAGIPIGSDGVPKPLLPPIAPQHVGRKCLVLDLDETLVHSSFKSIQQADYVVPVEIEFHWHNVYVIKRPGVDNFLKKMGEIYEIVVFTASLSKYADPVLDKLDVHRVVTHRLFRESCYNHKGNYVKDLSQLGRPIGDTIILDNSPASYIFHPNNAVPVSSWFNDPHDTELQDLIPFLSDLTMADDVRGVLDGTR